MLLAISRKLQYKQLVEAGALGRLPFIGIDSLDKDTARVVFQGTEGAYSQAAMEHYFGKGCNSYHVHTFREAMEAIEEGAADYAVLPIENSTAGAVNEIYDLLVNLKIILSERRSSRSKIHCQDYREQIYLRLNVYIPRRKHLCRHRIFWENTETGSRSV